MAEKNVLLKNQSLFLNFNTKSRSFSNTLTKKVKKKLLYQNLPIKVFLKTKFDQNKKNIIFKQKRTNKLFYNISIWILLRRRKKKKIKGFQS